MTSIESIVGSAGSMIKQQLVDEAVFLWGVRGQFEWIERELSRISRYLKDADAKAREGNNSIKGWLADVMGIAHDADDAITFFVWMEEQRKRRTPIQKCLFFCCDLLNLHKAGVMIEAVKKNIEEISTSRSNFRLEEVSGGESHEASSSRLQQYRNATSDFEEELFVGFEDDLTALRDNLTMGERRRCVVSIVAMGGAGKTTLARKLYNDSDVKDHFGPNVAWICVSQTYSIKELLKGIAEQVMGTTGEELTESQLREKLQAFLKQQKYLIVVDDIWNKEAWDLLRGAFPDGNEGSRILLTTRIEDVALYADRLSKLHKLPLLDEEESWDLFLNIVFPPREENGEPICPDQLEGIARQMVGKCGGLPLAIRVLGGLSFTTSDDATVWRKVLDHHLKWHLSSKTEHLSDILELSYLDLPDYLKPCFLYLGIFPEDYLIPVERLTRLWIAEGFVQAREKCSKEDVAEQYVGELAKRSMIQVIHEGYTCRVHDMLRDLAIKEAKRAGLFEIDDDPQLFEDASVSTSAVACIRRLGIHHSSSSEDYNRVSSGQSRAPPKVHSLLSFNNRGFQPQELGHAKWLRVLHWEKEKFMPRYIDGNAIRELVHLKYLEHEGLISLPSSIGKFYNLQTLNLGWAPILLPATIWSLHRLRHLTALQAIFDGRPQLELLQHLHTLSLKAGEWIEEKSLIKLSKLKNLEISFISDEFGETLIKAIQQMVNLRKLGLEGTYGVLPPFKPFSNNSQLEEITLKYLKILQEKPQTSLEFPPMLTKLELAGTYLKDDPMSTLGKLKNLRDLDFGNSAFLGNKLTVPEQGFPQLKRFLFVYLPNLEEWILGERAMPTLKHLKVDNCNKLKMLPERLQNIATLKKVEINNMPTKFRQRLMKNGGEDWHKIQHVPSVTISPRGH